MQKRKIKIESDIKTSKIRVKFMQEYIEMLEKLPIKIGKEIIYFFTMRILCIFDIRTMEKKGLLFIVYLFCIICMKLYQMILMIY